MSRDFWHQGKRDQRLDTLHLHFLIPIIALIQRIQTFEIQ